MSLVQIGGKVQKETKERFLAIRGEMTWEEILSELLTAYENRGENPEIPQIPEGYISPEDHAQALQLKDNEIGQLKTAHTLEIEALAKQDQELQETVKRLQNSINPAAYTDETKLVIDVNPFSKFVLSDEIQAYKKKHGLDLEPGELLFSYFLHMKKHGNVEPVYLWTEREFLQHQKRFETPPANDE